MAVSVSDHAVLRYLERVGGFDIAGLRCQISARCSAAAKAGASSIMIDGFEYVIAKDGVGVPIVTTVLDISNAKRRGKAGR